MVEEPSYVLKLDELVISFQIMIIVVINNNKIIIPIIAINSTGVSGHQNRQHRRSSGGR